MESSGKCRKKVVESFEFCFVDFLFVSHFPTDQTKALEKLLKDHAGKYATGDEVSMADLFLAPQILVGIERFNVDMETRRAWLMLLRKGLIYANKYQNCIMIITMAD